MDGLQSAIERDYGLRIHSVEPVSGGADPHAESFKVVSANGSRYFAKLRPEAGIGFQLAAFLAESGISEVLAPIRTQDGGISTNVGGRALVLLSFLEGWNGLDRRLGHRQWRMVGSALRQVHDTQLPRSILAKLPTESFRVEGASRLTLALREALKGGRRDDMAVLLRQRSEEIELAVRRTGELGEQCRIAEPKLVPSHADLHEANILVDELGSVHLVDWDLPRMAPRECDLMFFVEQGIFGEIAAEDEAAFFEGYGSVSPDPVLLAYFRFARVVEDLVAYYDEAKASGEWESATALGAVRGVEALFKPRSTFETAMRMYDSLDPSLRWL